MIIAIAAVDEEYGIGRENIIPWLYPKDLKWFKLNTLGNEVIMGKNTYDSIGKPLPNRKNVVLSNKRRGMITGVDFISFNEYITYHYDCNKTSFLAGGESIYRLFLERDLVKYIYLTKIPGRYQCDKFFPSVYLNNFKLYEISDLEELKVEKYVRKICN